MKNTFKQMMGREISNDPNWDLLSKLYEYPNYNTVNVIPKKIHQIWLGELDEKYEYLISIIKEKHQGWEYKLWTHNDLSKYPMRNREIYDRVKNPGVKSDIARYEILYNEGGIYLDTDFLMINNFDQFLNLDFFAGCGHVYKPEIFNGLIGCRPKLELMDILRNSVIDIDNIKTADDILNATGPRKLTSTFFTNLKETKDIKSIIFPGPYFYPLPPDERYKIRNNINNPLIKSFNTPETVCVHLWYTSWQ
jgi:hypothetical protein